MNNDDLLSRVLPAGWGDTVKAAASVPTSGAIMDPHGVVHGIFGDYTECGVAWYWANSLRVATGWSYVFEGTAPTCIVCLCDIP